MYLFWFMRKFVSEILQINKCRWFNFDVPHILLIILYLVSMYNPGICVCIHVQSRYLCLQNKATAGVCFECYIKTHPQVEHGPPFVRPLLNFIWMLLLAIEGYLFQLLLQFLAWVSIMREKDVLFLLWLLCAHLVCVIFFLVDVACMHACRFGQQSTAPAAERTLVVCRIFLIKSNEKRLTWFVYTSGHQTSHGNKQHRILQ